MEDSLISYSSLFQYLLRRINRVHDIYTIILLKYVCLSAFHKLQVAILARSSREMTLTVGIVILSRDRVSVRPSIFCISQKHS